MSQFNFVGWLVLIKGGRYSYLPAFVVSWLFFVVSDASCMVLLYFVVVLLLKNNFTYKKFLYFTFAVWINISSDNY